MRFVSLARFPLFAVALWIPTAALAGFTLPVTPERIDGGDFGFADDVAGTNNTLTFTADGTDLSAEGRVVGVNGGTGDTVEITYQLQLPNSSSAGPRSASVSQDTQVLVTLDVNGGGNYFGKAAPLNCKASVKVKDNGGPPSTPDTAQASLTCDLGNNWTEFDNDSNPGTPGDPPAATLADVDNAFPGRKDVQVDTQHGKLVIKFKGHAL